MSGKFSIAKRLKSFSYAFNGIWVAFKTQHNMWIHFTAMALVLVAGLYFHLSNTEWLIITCAIAGVLAAEIFNSAIETLVDLVSPEYNKKAGLVKDMAAGAVLITAFGAATIGVVIFLPKVLGLIH